MAGAPARLPWKQDGSLCQSKGKWLFNMEQSMRVSSVDDSTPWAVGKYVFITAFCTGGVGLHYFIICELSHLEVTSKRISVCALNVDEWGRSRAETVPPRNTSASHEKQLALLSARLIAQRTATRWFCLTPWDGLNVEIPKRWAFSQILEPPHPWLWMSHHACACKKTQLNIAH